MTGLLMLFQSFTLMAAMGILACFLVMFLAMLAWMFSLRATINVHAPLLDDVPAARRYAKPASVFIAAHHA